jgi:sulfoxide reductase heme-binding subunit YedZ
VYSLFKYRPVINMRRPLGVYAFVYIALHLTIFIFDNFVWSFGFSWDILRTTILEKRFILIGFAAFLIFLPMAITSTKGWQKRLGKRWTKLHKGVYIADILVIIHYVWLVKSDVRDPLAWGAGVLILLALRIPTVKRGAQALIERVKSMGKRAPTRQGVGEQPPNILSDPS